MKHFISLIPTIERPFYGGIFAVLAGLWCAFAIATLGLLLITLFPDCRGWDDDLRGLDGLAPPDPMFWSS